MVLSTRSSGVEQNTAEEYASGASGLQNLGNGFYQLNSKTPTSYVSSCQSLWLDMGEELFRTAVLQFTK